MNGMEQAQESVTAAAIMEHFSGSFTPVNGAETEPDTSNLTTGKIEYYAPGADMTKDEPTSTILGSDSRASPR